MDRPLGSLVLRESHGGVLGTGLSPLFLSLWDPQEDRPWRRPASWPGPGLHSSGYGIALEAGRRG